MPWVRKSLQVKIDCHSMRYDFYIRSLAADEWQQIGTMPAKALTRTRIYDSFCTGTMIGVYALGNPNRPCLQPAFFDGVQWKGVRGGALKIKRQTFRNVIDTSCY
jgi:beta-xylosidase